MQRKILEFFIGSFSGVIVLMTFAYMSVAIHNIGPVTVERTVERTAELGPVVMLTPPELIDREHTPIIQMVMPLSAAAAELKP